MVRVEFDQDSCIGSGICESLAEDVFRVGDDGVMTPVTDVVPDEREGAVTQAVARCPTGAIRVRSES
ncbi:MAG: ferredoxin [Mycobacterium sp.]|uniref:ferredoxin n=1 Tax=Mycobacterium sp. TaxID=1785 RepID=UPI003F970C73